ncbi:DUF418 domain-containing protein [Streptomyces sp. NPDC056716]|uniref:DUF418 domain-containing protein n=1 Tax=unclassified Streptomyces TaxID=2593676 RepID=UPI0036974DDC
MNDDMNDDMNEDMGTGAGRGRARARARARTSSEGMSNSTGKDTGKDAGKDSGEDTGEDIPGGVVRRVVQLDVLRGFALLGIVVVNAQMMAGPYYAFGGGPDASAFDRGVAWLITALVASKFYLLFSFLFGYSFVLQERSAARAGVPFGPRHLRRTVGLFALGLAHAVLLYPGDILMAYAVLALALYGARGLPPRTAVRLAAGLVVFLTVLLLLEGLASVAVTEPLTAAGYAPTAADTIAAYRGDALSVIGAHLTDLPGSIAANLLYSPDLFAAFLAGFAAGRVRLLERRGRDRAWLRRTALRRLPLGLLGGIVSALCANWPLDNRWFDVGHAVAVLTGPALTASYVCGLLLLLGSARRPARVLSAALASSGRLALTHYLTQSLVLALVFTGYGLGLYDRAGAAAVLAGSILLYGGQLALGAWLSGRFRYGPAELLLRTVTLARRPGARPDAGPSPAGRPA